MPGRESKSKRRKPPQVVEGPRVQAAPVELKQRSPLRFIERHRVALLLVLLVAGSARIVSTYWVFSHTRDEPGHIASGVDLLARGIYQFDPQHPPLTRIAVGLGPYMAGVQPPKPGKIGDAWIVSESREFLYSQGKYEQTLVLARLGNLPFFWISCVVVYLWGRRYFDPATGVLAVFLLSFFPPLLGHAGLATTDMGCAAMLGAAFLAACVFMEEPSPRQAAAFGLCGGLAILSKFSVLAYFPASAAAALVWYAAVERPQPRQIVQAVKLRAPLMALAALIACLVVWAGYRFSFAHGVPAPEFWGGIRHVAAHNAEGHRSYLLGQARRFGFWYFFPVVIAVKTPIAFLALTGAGIWLAVRGRVGRRAWLPVAYAGGILAVAMSSHINIGLRHILPMYMGLAAPAAAAATHAWSLANPPKWIRVAVPLLLLWLAVSSLASHPDYLAYFNELAGSQPENILVDSDLDWGQDVSRLGRRLQALGVHEVTFMPGDDIQFGIQPGFEGITVNQNMASVPTSGWNAVGLTVLKTDRLGLLDTHPELTLWPNVIPPTERVGKSILLWYFPPGGSVPTIPFPSRQGR